MKKRTKRTMQHPAREPSPHEALAQMLSDALLRDLRKIVAALKAANFTKRSHR